MNKDELKQFTVDLLNAWESRDKERIASMYNKNVRSHMGEALLNSLISPPDWLFLRYSMTLRHA